MFITVVNVTTKMFTASAGFDNFFLGSFPFPSFSSPFFLLFSSFSSPPLPSFCFASFYPPLSLPSLPPPILSFSYLLPISAPPPKIQLEV